jgi:uncharacterized protein
MSQEENLANTKKAYAAFAAADIEGASEGLSDDIEWIVPGNSTISGTYRGKDEVIGLWITLAGKGFASTPQEFFASENRVIVLTTSVVEGQSSDEVDVLTLVDGKVVKFQSVSDTALGERVWGAK